VNRVVAIHTHPGPWPEIVSSSGVQLVHRDRASTFWRADEEARIRADLLRFVVAGVVALVGLVVPLAIAVAAYTNVLGIPPGVVVMGLLVGVLLGTVRINRRPLEPTIPRFDSGAPEAIADAAAEVAIAAGIATPRIVVSNEGGDVPWAIHERGALTVVLDTETIGTLDRSEWQATIALLVARAGLVGRRRLRARYVLVDLMLLVHDVFVIGALIEPDLWVGHRLPGTRVQRIGVGIDRLDLARIGCGGVVAVVLLMPVILPFTIVRLMTRLAVRILLQSGQEEIYRADADSVALTREPRSLAWALAHLTTPEAVRRDVLDDPAHAIAHAAYYAVPPSHARSGSTSYDFPPIADRIAQLRGIGGG
jgi:hypothetical protein